VRASIENITFNYMVKYPATWSRLTMLMRFMHAICSRLALACKMINYITKHRKYRLCPNHYGEISAKRNSFMVFVLLILEFLDIIL